MNRALMTAATGMDAQQKTIQAIANNLANINTTGFKASRANFVDLLYQTIQAPGTQTSNSTESPSGLQLGLGTRTVSVQRMDSQGDIKASGNSLDMAIEGKGYFRVTMPGGDVGYTRAGNFNLDSQGRLVTADGNPLDPEITIPAEATSITIGSDGTVSVTQAGSTTSEQVGQVTLTTFPNPAGLLAIGRNLLQETSASGSATDGTPGQQGVGAISQGMLELSNVDIVAELVNMIAAQRAYELGSKVITSTDQMLRNATSVIR